MVVSFQPTDLSCMWQTEEKDFEIHKQNANPRATLLLMPSSFGDWL